MTACYVEGMNNAALMVSESSPVRWHVVGYRESVYQSCQGAPVQAGGTCQKCGASIRYVVTVKSTAGEVMDVGRDCAVTLKGGPELSEIRRAEREYERQLWLASPEYARQQAERKAREEAAAERASAAEVDHAFALAGLRAIQACATCSGYEKDTAAAAERAILTGTDGAGCFDETQARVLSMAALKAYLPASRHVGQVGQRIEMFATFEACIPVETAYGVSYVQKFRANDGAALVWFSAGGGLGQKDIGEAVLVDLLETRWRCVSTPDAETLSFGDCS